MSAGRSDMGRRGIAPEGQGKPAWAVAPYGECGDACGISEAERHAAEMDEFARNQLRAWMGRFHPPDAEYRDAMDYDAPGTSAREVGV